MHSGNTLSFFPHPFFSRTLLMLPSQREEKRENGDRSLYKGKFSCQYPSCPWEFGGFCVLVFRCHRLQLIIRQAKQLQPYPLPNRDSINALAFQKQIHPIIGKDICQLFRSLIRLKSNKVTIHQRLGSTTNHISCNCFNDSKLFTRSAVARQTVHSIHILPTMAGSNLLIPKIFWQQIQKLMVLQSISILALRHCQTFC